MGGETAGMSSVAPGGGRYALLTSQLSAGGGGLWLDRLGLCVPDREVTSSSPILDRIVAY